MRRNNGPLFHHYRVYVELSLLYAAQAVGDSRLFQVGPSLYVKPWLYMQNKRCFKLVLNFGPATF